MLQKLSRATNQILLTKEKACRVLAHIGAETFDEALAMRTRQRNFSPGGALGKNTSSLQIFNRLRMSVDYRASCEVE